MTQVNAGRVRFVSRGEYNNTTQYYLFDLVNYEGSSYVAIGNTLGNIPTNTTYWQLVAEKGNVGSVGPVGPQGVGIASTTKTATVGLVDTYTITYTDGTTTTFNVTNGEDGDVTPTEFNALKADVEDLRDNQIISDEVTGTNININDAAKCRVYDLKMDKESTQETTTGKNKAKIDNLTTQTINDVTFTPVYENGQLQYINVNGTASSGTNYNLNNPKITLSEMGLSEGISYILSGCAPDGQAWTTYQLYLNVTGGGSNYVDVGNGITFTPTANDMSSTYSISIYVKSGVQMNNLKFYPMIRLSSVSDNTYEPYTNGPSPNPSYPQEVKTVKGYRNLFDKNNANIVTNAFINQTGYDFEYYIDSSRNIYRTFTMQIDSNTTYTISKIVTSRFAVATSQNIPTDRMRFTKGSQQNNATSITITSGVNDNYLTVWCMRTDLDTTITDQEVLNSMMIIEGTEPLPYVPYGNNYINAKIIGKNLFDKSTITSIYGGTINNDIITSNAISTGYGGVSANFTNLVLQTGTYYILLKLKLDSGSSSGVNGIIRSATPNTSTITTTVKPVLSNEYQIYKAILTCVEETTLTNIGVQLAGTNNSAIISVKDIMVSVFDDTNYEAFKESNVPIPLNNNELVGIETYKDELLVDKSGHVFINKKTGKVVLNGSETWQKSSNTSLDRFYLDNASFNMINRSSGYSNYFINSTTVVSDIGKYYTNANQIVINFSTYNTTNLEQFKTWLSTHNTDVYYVLETPDTIDLQTTVDLKLFKGVNNVSNSEDGYMSIRYVESIDSVINEIEDIKTRLTALEGTSL